MASWKRFGYLVKANIHSMLDRAEDRDRMRRALLAEMRDALESARVAGADLKAEMDHFEQHAAECEKGAARWRERAEEALRKGQEDLAKEALKQAQELARRQHDIHVQVERLKQREDRLKDHVASLHDKHQQLKAVTEKPAPRAAAASPAERTLSRFDRRYDGLEHRLRRLEARVRAYEEPAPATATVHDAEVDAELDELRSKVNAA